MLSDRIVDKAVEALSKRLRVENEVIERNGRLHLDTHIMVSSRVIYSHSMDLTPVTDHIISRIDDSSQ